MTNEPNPWLDADTVRLVERLTPEPRPEAHAYIAVAAWVVAAFLAAFVIAAHMHN